MTGLVVGRFQPLHKGHVSVIETALDAEAGDVVVAIGSSQEEGTDRNPWSFEERQAMIHALWPSLTVVAVPDIHDPPNWVAHLQDLVGPFDRAYGNDLDTLALFEEAGIDVIVTGEEGRDVWSGTRIRDQIGAGEDAWRNAVPRLVWPIVAGARP